MRALSAIPERPPASPVAWRVGLKPFPALNVEVAEQFWLDARQLGAVRISAKTGATVMIDDVEAAPVASNIRHIEAARSRRADTRNTASVR